MELLAALRLALELFLAACFVAAWILGARAALEVLAIQQRDFWSGFDPRTWFGYTPPALSKKDREDTRRLMRRFMIYWGIAVAAVLLFLVVETA